MGFENISANNGIGIAATGMVIVFFALLLISLFIFLLPHSLKAISSAFPPTPAPPTIAEAEDVDGNDLIAAIGFVLHEIESRKTGTV